MNEADTCRKLVQPKVVASGWEGDPHSFTEQRTFTDGRIVVITALAEHGTAHFIIPDVLKVPPISEQGNVVEIVQLFGGAERLREAVNQLQTLLYVA